MITGCMRGRRRVVGMKRIVVIGVCGMMTNRRGATIEQVTLFQDEFQTTTPQILATHPAMSYRLGLFTRS